MLHKLPAAAHLQMDLAQINNLRPYVGYANVETLNCINETCGLVASTVKLKPGYDWARCLVCDVCNTSWYVCTICGRSKSKFTKTLQLKHHERRSHREKEKLKRLKDHQKDSLKSNVESTKKNSHDSVSSEEYFRDESVVGKPEMEERATTIKLEHVGTSSKHFFTDNLEGRGVYKLVARSQYHIENLDEDLVVDDVKMFVGLCRLANELSRAQRDRLAYLLDLVVEHTKKSCDPSRMHIAALETKVPTSPSEVRDMFIKGTHAMVPNLPRPNVQLIGDHAYVSVKECIQDVLGHGVPVESILTGDEVPTVTKLSESKAANNIWKKAQQLYGDKLYGDALCLYITEWSDDFEPNAMNKAGRGSIWIKTITIASPTAGRQTIANTYPIAVGPKGSSHEAVELKFMEELAEIQNDDFSCYVKSSSNVVPVYAAVIASLQDQPERRSINFIMAGNGKYASRWRYSANLQELQSKVPSCDSCLSKLFAGEDCISCDVCTNWSFDLDSPLLATKAPTKYPQEMLPTSGELKPRRIEYDSLLFAVKMAKSKLISEDWSADEAKEYLMAEGLNHVLIRQVIDAADRIANYQYLEKEKESFPDEFGVIDKHRKARPDLYDEWKPPVAWRRGTSMDQRIDAIMHLLYLGVMKTLMQLTQDFLTLIGKNTSFLRYASGVMESVQQLNVSWCKALPYKSGKLGGWVSENYLAMARLSKWFYSRVGELHTEQVQVELTLSGKTKWTKIKCQQWLRARRLATDGNAAEIKSRVESLLKLQGGPPPVVDLPTYSEVQQVHHAFAAVVSQIMTNTVSESDVESVQLHIKIFLSLFQRFEKKIYPSKKTPGWVSSYNFSSLLNIPESMSLFGPLRNLWEGGYQGEGVLRYVKPEASYGMRKNWQCRLVERVLDTKSIEQMELSLDALVIKAEDPSDGTSEDEDSTQCKTYKDEVSAMADFGKGLPISAVRLDDGTVGTVLKGGILMELTRVGGDTPTTLNGCIYSSWTATCNGQTKTRENWRASDIAMYLLLLPLLDTKGKPSFTNGSRFFVINEEWKEMHADGTFHYPAVIKP